VTVVTAINKLRCRNPYIAKVASEFVRENHKNFVLMQAQWINKFQMDNWYSAGRRGRLLSSTWGMKLHRAIFQAILETYGLQQMQVLDLMACAQTTQAARFVSRYPGHRNLWTDALSRPWPPQFNRLIQPTELLYCFPPEKLIPAVLQHIEVSASSCVLLILPAFCRSWMSTLCRLAISPPIVFGGGTKLLIPPEGHIIAGDKDHRNWSWIACLVSGMPDEWRDGRTRPPPPTATDGGRHVREAVATTLPGNDGYATSTGRDIVSFFSQQPRW
jgi:hypothetical protein